MIYKSLEHGTHQLSITGPELADIAELIATLSKLGEDAAKVSYRLFDFLGFQQIYEASQALGGGEPCFEKVYKHSADGAFHLTFSNTEYYTMVNLLLLLNDTDHDTVSIRRKLFNALGLQEAFKEFISSPEGRDIF